MKDIFNLVVLSGVLIGSSIACGFMFGVMYGFGKIGFDFVMRLLGA